MDCIHLLSLDFIVSDSSCLLFQRFFCLFPLTLLSSFSAELGGVLANSHSLFAIKSISDLQLYIDRYFSVLCVFFRRHFSLCITGSMCTVCICGVVSWAPFTPVRFWSHWSTHCVKSSSAASSMIDFFYLHFLPFFFGFHFLYIAISPTNEKKWIWTYSAKLWKWDKNSQSSPICPEYCPIKNCITSEDFE